MDNLKLVFTYQLLGVPVWTWLLMVAPAVNEWINRSKWTTAQSLWQFLWRLVAATPLMKVPMVGQVVALMAAMKKEEAPPPNPSFILIFILPALTGCAAQSLERRLHNAVYTAATASHSCYEMLNAADSAKIADFQQHLSDPQTEVKFEEWKKTVTAILITCRSARVTSDTAHALIPTIMAAVDKDKQAAQWIERLTKLASDIMESLKSIDLFGGD